MTDEPDIDDDLENADTTALLAGMYAELHRMRQIMEMDAFDLEYDGENIDPVFSCTKCGEHVESDERQEHLTRKHNAPPSIDETEYFTEV